MNKQAKAPLDKTQVDELCEDMEVVGPGLMLSDARRKLSLSIEDVAGRLKFQTSLVQNIEQDIFDPKLPATFNRGYLRSYAKLVNVDVDEVLSAYDMLGVAELQRSEMQSFSNLTEKEAEHSRLMWLSYFIAAILIGLMILWWQQEPKQAFDENAPDAQPRLSHQNKNVDKNNKTELAQQESTPLVAEQPAVEAVELSPVNESTKQAISKPKTVDLPVTESPVTELKGLTGDEVDSVSLSANKQEPMVDLSTAVFTFSGDCWVNIFDATGERIAWGIKKSGYVMTVTGKAPLKITLGKPELAAIVFNGQSIDMSVFNVGNIAKFTLPLSL